MEPIFRKDFEITDMCVDRFGFLKPSVILMFAQEVAGMHCVELACDYDTLFKKHLFWAVARHSVQITRLPRIGQTIRVETWPMPTTRAAYPRSMVAYDEKGNECFRSISLWVLMDTRTRNMILPGKSGISVLGTLRGGELPSPSNLMVRPQGSIRNRRVSFTDLDRNGHMNNTRYLEWIDDLFPSDFHASRTLREFTICYLSEAREGEELTLRWELREDNCLYVDAHRPEEDKETRIFSAQLRFD